MESTAVGKLVTGLIGMGLLSACFDSGSGGGSDPEPPKTGYFIDSGVQGLSYSSPSHSGTTGPNGSFSYEAGETVSFSLYGLSLGSAAPSTSDPVVTPSRLLGDSRSASEMDTFLNGSDAAAQQIVNFLVLLQSFDDDGQPENGIYIPAANESGQTEDYSNLLQDLVLNQSSADFTAAITGKLAQHERYEASDLVTEADAIAHFIDSLESLEKVAEYEGRWYMRSGDHGDLSAVYTFASGGRVDLLEYHNCPDNLWGSTESLLSVNCTTEQYTQSFTTNGSTINLVGSSFTDTCLPISINDHEAKLTCDFFGSGLGNEVITLQRAPESFTEEGAPLVGSYRDLTAGSAVGSFSLASNNTGSYTGDTFAWSATATALDIDPTTDSDVTLNFRGYIKGSWLIGEGSNGVNVILNSTQNTTNGNLLNISGFFGRFDANPNGSGQCKGVSFFYDNGATYRLDYANALNVNYACDYPLPYSLASVEAGAPDEGAQPTSTELVTFTSTSMEYTSYDRECFLLGIDEYELNTYYVACETGSDTFDIEIWKPL